MKGEKKAMLLHTKHQQKCQHQLYSRHILSDNYYLSLPPTTPPSPTRTGGRQCRLCYHGK